MEYRAECFSTLAHLLEAPDAAFSAHLALATDPALVPPQVAGNVALFAERVGELTIEERQELFSETFGAPLLAGDRQSVVAWLRSADQDGVACAGAAVARLCEILARDRNPYHHLCVAVRSLLLGQA